MSKAITKESDGEDDAHDRPAEESAHADLAGLKNYITPSGLQRLRDELTFLLARERPAVTQGSPGRRATATAAKTRTTSTAKNDCAKSIGGFVFSPSESTPRKWWTRKAREMAGRRPGSRTPLVAAFAIVFLAHDVSLRLTRVPRTAKSGTHKLADAPRGLLHACSCITL